MDNWDHTVVSFNDSRQSATMPLHLQLEVIMNRRGEDGWELGGMVATDGDIFLAFKRPKR